MGVMAGTLDLVQRIYLGAEIRDGVRLLRPEAARAARRAVVADAVPRHAAQGDARGQRAHGRRSGRRLQTCPSGLASATRCGSWARASAARSPSPPAAWPSDRRPISGGPLRSSRCGKSASRWVVSPLAHRGPWWCHWLPSVRSETMLYAPDPRSQSGDATGLARAQHRARPGCGRGDGVRARRDPREHREPRGRDAYPARHRRTHPRQGTARRRAVLRALRDHGGDSRHDLPVRHAGDHRGGWRQRVRAGGRARHHPLLRGGDDARRARPGELA